MESANLPARFSGPQPPANDSVMPAVLAGLVFGTAGAHFLRHAGDFRFVAVLCVALALWHIHLSKTAVPRWLPLAAVAVLSAQLLLVPAAFTDLAALSGGIFVYLLIWVLAEYDRQPALQGVAPAALLLSGGVLAKPPIALSCIVLSLAFFLMHIRSAANPAGFGLLLFTPAALCAAGTLVFAFLNASSLFAQPSVAPPIAPDVVPGFDWGFLFLFPAAVIAFRAFRRCLCGADLAFLAMCALGAMICRGQWMKGALGIADLFFLAAGGAAALVSTSGCRKPGTGPPPLAHSPRPDSGSTSPAV